MNPEGRAEYNRHQNQVTKEYMTRFDIEAFAKWTVDHNGENPPQTHMKKVVDRIYWQTTELQHFVVCCFYSLGRVLQEVPIKIPSGKYEEKLKVERTQADLVNEMAQELGSLPKYTAMAKVLQGQTVWKGKIKTIELPPKRWLRPACLSVYPDMFNTNRREQIEKEIKERQEAWKVKDAPKTQEGGVILLPFRPVDDNEPPPPTRYKA